MSQIENNELCNVLNLGHRSYLDDFTEINGGFNLMNVADETWRQIVLDQIKSGDQIRVVVNSFMKGESLQERVKLEIQRGIGYPGVKKKHGTYTGWELLQIEEAGLLNEVHFYEQIDNEFVKLINPWNSVYGE